MWWGTNAKREQLFCDGAFFVVIPISPRLVLKTWCNTINCNFLVCLDFSHVFEFNPWYDPPLIPIQANRQIDAFEVLQITLLVSYFG